MRGKGLDLVDVRANLRADRMTTRTRNLIIVGSVLLLGAYLAGYLPQYSRASNLQEELQRANERVQTLQRDAGLMRARALAHRIHLETAKKNYGVAVQHAEQFFSYIQALANEAQDPALKNGLAQIASQRQAVIADLSQVAPTADERVRQLVEQVQELTDTR